MSVDPSSRVTSRSTLTWLLIVGLLLMLWSPWAGLTAVLLVATVTAVRPDLRRDLLWDAGILLAGATVMVALLQLPIAELF